MFVFICLLDNSDSINYIKKQIEKVKSIKKNFHNQSFIIVNSKHCNHKNYHSNYSLLEEISRKYEIPFEITNINDFSFFSNNENIKKSCLNFEDFLKTLI